MIEELSVRELMALGLGVLLSLGWANTSVAHTRLVPTSSMAPTFEPGDRLLIVPQRGQAIRRGDILTFRPLPRPRYRSTEAAELAERVSSAEHPYVKRCVALPGDRIEVRPGQGLLLNGRRLQESYLAERPRYRWGPATVPPGHLFVLGDNRNESEDSHIWGYLPVERVIGRPIAVIWPLDRLRRF